MQSAGEPRLVVDYGAAGVVAVLMGPGGRWQPIFFDANPGTMSSAVAVAADGTQLTGEQAWQAGFADPSRFVAAPLTIPDDQIQVADAPAETAGLVAATLRRVMDEATRLAGAPVPDVWLVVPASWGPRRRMWMRQAAARAGMGQPTLVEAPIAVVQHLIAGGRQIPVGTYLVVCDIGAGCEATVLRRNPSGLEVLSTLSDPAAGGNAIDEAVAAALEAMTGGAAAGNRVALLAAARAAKEAAGRQMMVSVAVAVGGPAVVIGADVIQRAAWPILQRAADLTAEAIKAAELDTVEISAVLCAGGTTEMPQLGQAMWERVGAQPEKVLPPQAAALYGAAGVGGRPSAPVPPVPPLPTGRRVWSIAVPAVAAFAVAAHVMYYVRTENYHPRMHSKWLFGEGFLVNWGALATSSILTMIFALTAATVIAGALANGHARGELSSFPRGGIGTALILAVAAGMSVPALFAVFATAMFEEPLGPWLRWTLLPVLPIAAVAAGTAVLAARWRKVPEQGWDEWLSFPVSAVLFVAAGTIIAQQAGTDLPFNYAWEPTVRRTGGLLIGIGIGLSMVPLRRYRWLLAIPSGLFVAAIIDFRTTPTIAGLFAIVVTVWWAQRAWQLIRSPIQDVRL